MKKIIYFSGIFFLFVIVILNILYTAVLSPSETISINSNSFICILGLLSFSFVLLLFSKEINNYLSSTNSKYKKISFIVLFSVYMIFAVLWTIFINPKIVGDQLHVSNLAQAINRGTVSSFLESNTYANIPIKSYLVSYPQQITLGIIYSIFFRLICFDFIELLRIINIVSLFFIILALYKIKHILSQKYTVNNILFFILLFTFVTLPMFCTFVYGDIPCLAFCFSSVYFTMKFVDSEKTKYLLFASILSMFGYMLRMNSLIFIIASVIYLILALFNKTFTLKERGLKIFLIFIYILISIVPSKLIQNMFFKKYDIEHTYSYPKVSYFLMGIEESPRGNGWYNEDIALPALTNPQYAINEYPQKLKNRLIYFSKNISHCFNFYIMKLASMWTETTYSAIGNNYTDYIDLDNIYFPLEFYQKVLLVASCISCFCFLVKNKQNLSLEILFLLVIFIGGFSFHILWEAKSRYIIPYILAIIPISSIIIKKNKTT